MTDKIKNVDQAKILELFSDVDQAKILELFSDVDQAKIPEHVQEVVAMLKKAELEMLSVYDEIENDYNGSVDRRWFAIAKTDFETSMMSLIRSVTE